MDEPDAPGPQGPPQAPRPRDGADLAPRGAGGDLTAAEELPVVARLAIEIRSDGIRTVARGAMHDIASGQQVAIEVNAGSVLELGTQLAAAVGKSLLSLPRLIFGRRKSR